MKKEFKEALEDSPIIAAIKDADGLHKSLTSNSRIIFILYGDICNIADIVDTVKSSGKLALVHIDLIAGLSSKEIAVDFLKKYTRADGIITTKPSLIKRAKELGFYTILRLFVIDSMAYENLEKQVRTAKPDVLEILPALMPKVIAKICGQTTTPIITGGLVSEKEDVIALLQSGATSVSSTNETVWFL
jgi:glycerol-3-phosphate responsive antiterminator